MKKKRAVLVVTWVSGTLLLSALTSWWLLNRQPPHQHAGEQKDRESEAAFHAWMHQNLGLTAEQEAVMAPQETVYETERRRLRTEIKEAGLALALRVREAEGFDADMSAALERLGAAQRRLQEATLRHFFEMKAQLNEPQRELLRRWTHDSLLHEHEH